MRLSWWCSPPLLAAALLASAPACSVTYRDGGPGSDPTATPDENTELEFSQKGTITLAPGEVRALTVTSDPPGRYEISFALLGDALDASLDQAKVTARLDGTATVNLKAPNVSTSFRVRASIKNGPAAETSISVSDTAFGSIRVVPVYAGNRDVTVWTASVIAGSNCKSIAPTLPSPEPVDALKTDVAAGGEIVIDKVPAGPNLAVVLRAGYSMWGCSDQPSLQAEQTLDVKVTVVDRPLDLLATNMDLTFSFTASDPEGYGELLDESAARLAEGFLSPTSEEAAEDLLAAMEAAAPVETVAAFQQNRLELSWDDLVMQHLAALPVSLRDQVETWSLAALAPTGDPMVPPTSQIVASLGSVGQESGKALLVVNSLGDVEAGKAGIPATHLVSWTADASDSVMLGGSIFWLPSRYAGAAALIGAKAQMQGVASMSEALSQVLGCGVLAAAMGGFEGCDVQCTAGLCNAALASRWEAGLNASADANLAGEISIKASAPAKVDGYAAPSSFSGKWLGTISAGGVSTMIDGLVAGLAKAPEPD